MKKISLVFLISICLFIIYQFQKPILTEDNAIIKAKEYIQVINKKMNADYLDGAARCKVLIHVFLCIWQDVNGVRCVEL